MKTSLLRTTQNAVLALTFCSSQIILAAALKTGDEIPLWGKETPPGSSGITLVEASKDGGTPGDPQRTITQVINPTITAYVPTKPNGTSAVITAGGGYTSLVIDKEGTDIAKWLNTQGITAFVLKFRLPGDGHADGKNVPLQDGQRAIRLVRQHASEWGLDPQKIGIFGFSSGGHTASMIGTAYNKKVYDPRDTADSLSARPDFMVLAYGPHSSNARKYLVNPKQAPVTPLQKQELYDEYPTDQMVTKDTPPTFLMHTDEDNKVDPRNSVRFYLALKQAGLPAELHIFKDGKHGVAIRNTKGLPVAIWPRLCEDWMNQIGMIKKDAK